MVRGGLRSVAAALLLACALAALLATLLPAPALAGSTVTFSSDNASYGTLSGSSKAIVADGAALGSKAPAPKPKSGYVFEGWYRAGKRLGADISAYKPVGNEALVAHFTLPAHKVETIAGADRIATSLAAARKQQALTTGTRGVIIAYAWDFPDALAAAALSGLTGYPVVLTGTAALPQPLLDFMRTTDVREVIVVGGEPSVSRAAYNQAKAVVGSGHIKRLAGANRFGTAEAIYADGYGRWGSTVVIASASSFADATSIGPYCNRHRAPILLASAKGLTAESRSLISRGVREGRISDIVIVGGAASVPESVRQWCAGKLGAGHVRRISGANRFETSSAIASWCVGKQGMSYDNVALVSGSSYADGLSAAPVQGASNSVVLLVRDDDAGKAAYRAVMEGLANMRIFGGLPSVPQGIRDEVRMRYAPLAASPGNPSELKPGVASREALAYASATTLSSIRGAYRQGAFVAYRDYNSTWAVAQLGGETVYLLRSCIGAAPSPSSMPAETVLTTLQVAAYGEDAFFTVASLPDAVFARMQGKSYPAGCTVPRANLSYVRVLHKDAAGRIKVGELVVNRAIAQRTLGVFRELYHAGYPIERMRLVDDYGADDEASMAANNTSAFNYRTIAGTSTLSNHALGLAIDVNPLYNPYVIPSSGYVSPAAGAPYADRSAAFPYKIEQGDLCCRLFATQGFAWGGDWTSPKDYQHFEMPASSV